MFQLMFNSLFCGKNLQSGLFPNKWVVKTNDREYRRV